MRCPTCGGNNTNNATACVACGMSLAEGTPPSNFLAPGSQLSGNAYTISKVLGQGGFGITYLGSDVRRNRRVAIKEFFPHGCIRQKRTVQPSGGMRPTDYESVKKRFLDEADLLSRFQHASIVQVYTSFEENNTAYMVMECVKGKTLQQLVEDGSPLPESEAVDYIEQVGEALEIVHEAHLLHRDIKPENIMVTDAGRVVLIDFGAAREFAAGKTKRMTQFLTPGYAPLEQYGQQARFGEFTDTYALGATLYHLLTGRVPVAATDRAAGVELKPPQTLNPQVSSVVSDAVMWAMETEVAKRPSGVRDFLDALHQEPPEFPEDDGPTPPTEAAGPSVADVLVDVGAKLISNWLQKKLGGDSSEGQSSASPINLGGTWRAPDGLSYTIRHLGNYVAMQGTNPYGMRVMVGEGTMVGRRMDLRYQLADGTGGTATAEVSGNGQQINGAATNLATGRTYPITLYR